MTNKNLGRLVQFVIVCMFLLGLVLCGILIPEIGKQMRAEYPTYSYAYTPWLSFIWIDAFPCFAALILGFKVGRAIVKDMVFTVKVSKWLKSAAFLVLSSVFILFIGNIMFSRLNLTMAVIVIGSFIMEIIGFCIAIILAVLSLYVKKAAKLKEEVDGTI